MTGFATKVGGTRHKAVTITVRKTKAEAEHTREAILDAAEHVFYEHGVAGASLEEVARVAGVTRGAVYWHFDNKLQIVLAIGERCILPHDEALRRLELSTQDDKLQALEHCISSTFAAFGCDEAARIRLAVTLLRCDYVGEMAPALRSHAARIDKLNGQFVGYFCHRLVPDVAAADWHPEVVAKAFTSMLHGTLMLWLRTPDQFRLDTVGIDNVRTFIRMVRNRWWACSGS